jgi:hypothetical protein
VSSFTNFFFYSWWPELAHAEESKEALALAAWPAGGG